MGPVCPAGLEPFRGQVSIQPHSLTHTYLAKLQLPQLPQRPHILGKVSPKLQ